MPQISPSQAVLPSLGRSLDDGMLEVSNCEAKSGGIKSGMCDTLSAAAVPKPMIRVRRKVLQVASCAT